MRKLIPLILLISSFLIIKIHNNGVRLSDTNIYYNMAYQIFQGNLPYRDFFFSNFPFFSYIFSIYYALIGKNIELFYFTANIEVAIITTLIYAITYHKTKNYIVSTVSSALYIFSFMILSTSDHQTGVFTASLLAVFGYYFLQQKKIIYAGVFIGASVFTKAYFLPLFLAFFVYFLIKKMWKNLLKFCVVFTATGLIILLPFLIQVPNQVISDIFGFSLVRPIGLSKLNIMWFFITKDFPIFILLIFNIFNIRKNILFGLMSIFSILFFFSYQDVYYLYLNFLVPFACLSFYELFSFLKTKFNVQNLVIPTIISVFILFNLLIYLSSYRNLGKVDDINKIKQAIISENPKFLYGVNDITPALLSLTHIPALENITDAHEYFFIKKIYNKEALTEKAVKSKTIIITHGADYPEYNIKQDILDNIFIEETIYKNCRNILSVPVQSEGDANRINLFKCY